MHKLVVEEAKRRGNPEPQAGKNWIASSQGLPAMTIVSKALYSAAARSFELAAFCMKSQMRGTISDLNREPLNTP